MKYYLYYFFNSLSSSNKGNNVSNVLFIPLFNANSVNKSSKYIIKIPIKINIAILIKVL